MTKSGANLGLLDLSSDVPPVEASSGQEQYYIRSAGHFVNLWVRLTFDLITSLVEASGVQEWYYVKSA